MAVHNVKRHQLIPSVACLGQAQHSLPYEWYRTPGKLIIDLCFKFTGFIEKHFRTLPFSTLYLGPQEFVLKKPAPGAPDMAE